LGGTIRRLFSKNLNRTKFKRLWFAIFDRAEKFSTPIGFRWQLKEVLGFMPRRTDWYRKAFTHPGFNLRDKDGNRYNFERLEFLGDSVLSMVVAEYLFRRYPDKNEGELTDIRARMVSRKTLNRIGRHWKLRQFLPRTQPQHYGYNLEGNLLEALVGAVLMDRGYRFAQKFILQKIIPLAQSESLPQKITSYKSEIILWCQKNHKPYRFYTQIESAQNGQQRFYAQFYVDKQLFGRGRALSKKKAEEIAARNAYNRLVANKP